MLTKNVISYEPLLILAPQKPITKELSDYGFDEFLMEEIKRSKVFPTVNGNYISFDEDPKFHAPYLSIFFIGRRFREPTYLYRKQSCNQFDTKTKQQTLSSLSI